MRIFPPTLTRTSILILLLATWMSLGGMTTAWGATLVEFPLAPLTPGEPLEAQAVLAQVSPTVAHVTTPRMGGSGVLVEPGYLVTNAHVVWPYATARVVFPDGTEIAEAPVVAWDLVADVALVGPLDVPITPVTLVDGSTLQPGMPVYLIGYPGEREQFPQPTLTQGLLARVRVWEPIDLTLLQVDTQAARGQSGGVLVTARGEVVGITSFSFADAQYLLASSAADLAPRLAALLNKQAKAFSDRLPLASPAQREQTGRLDGESSYNYYVIDAPSGEEVTLRIAGRGYPMMEVLDSFGQVIAESTPAPGRGDTPVEAVTFTAELGRGPYMVRVDQMSEFRNDYTLTGSYPLHAYADPDDGRNLLVGSRRPASIDFPDEWDQYSFALKAGDKIAVHAESLLIDPVLTLLYESPGQEQWVFNDDAGLGLAGTDARLVYTAEADGLVSVMVRDDGGEQVGGYFISVRKAGKEEPPTPLAVDRTFSTSDFGQMETYTSAAYGYTLGYPAYWYSENCPESVTACFTGSSGASLFIAEDDMSDLRSITQTRGQAGIVDMMAEAMMANLPDAKLIERTLFTTTQGLVGERLRLSFDADRAVFDNFAYFDAAQDVVFSAAYFVSSTSYPSMASLIGESFATFRSWHGVDPEQNAAYYLDEAGRHRAREDSARAVDALGRAIALDPTQVEAYFGRAQAYRDLGEYDLAIADLETILELAPDDVANYLMFLGMTYWRAGDLEQALAALDEAIALDDEAVGFYNNRALVRATAGDGEGALADMARLAELYEGELDAGVLDTRGFVYLQMGDHAAALADYTAALDQDYQIAYVLLGSGIARARLDQMDEALPLLEYGLERWDVEKVAFPDPQIQILLAQAQEILDSLK